MCVFIVFDIKLGFINVMRTTEETPFFNIQFCAQKCFVVSDLYVQINLNLYGNNFEEQLSIISELNG